MLVFLDESGFLMSPLVRRSWSPRGVTPILYQRGGLRRKVSALAALCLAGDFSDCRLYFRLHAEANITAARVIAFLRQLLRQLPRPVILLWDRFQSHRAKSVRDFLHHHPQMNSFFFPSYSPEFNPVEYLWSYLKMNPFANWAPYSLAELTAKTRDHSRRVQRNPSLLASFLKHSPLFLNVQ